jgi:hypothetical protein
MTQSDNPVPCGSAGVFLLRDSLRERMELSTLYRTLRTRAESLASSRGFYICRERTTETIRWSLCGGSALLKSRVTTLATHCGIAMGASQEDAYAACLERIWERGAEFSPMDQIYPISTSAGLSKRSGRPTRCAVRPKRFHRSLRAGSCPLLDYPSVTAAASL